MSFSADLGKFRSKTTDRLDRTRRAVVIKLFSAVILDTPVLSGRLRGNWQTGVKSPVLGTVGRLDKSGSDAIAEVQKQTAASGPDDAMYLTNNLPYARRIEYEGWSKKAPDGMVRRNVIRFRRLLDEAVREGKL